MAEVVGPAAPSSLPSSSRGVLRMTPPATSALEEPPSRLSASCAPSSTRSSPSSLRSRPESSGPASVDGHSQPLAARGEGDRHAWQPLRRQVLVELLAGAGEALGIGVHDDAAAARDE